MGTNIVFAAKNNQATLLTNSNQNLFELMKRFCFCFSVPHVFGRRIYRLRESVPCYNQSSNSAILSIAAYIVNHFPKLRPPNISHQVYSQTKFAQPFSAYHPFDQAWANYLMQLVTNNHAIYHNHTLFAQILLQDLNETEGLQKHFELLDISEDIKDHHERCKYLFDLPSIPKVDKKIGIVAYRPLATNMLEPRINSPALFIGNLYNNQHWSIFRIADYAIPPVEELSTYSCIILPGSLYSVCDNPPHYIKTVIDNIIQAYRINKNLKIIGTCFGHQILAQCFGAKVEKIGRVGGIERVEFDLELSKQFSFLKDVCEIPQLYLSEHHEDFVTTIPEGFMLLAHSKSCDYQSFISKDGRIFTTQFHSEYMCPFTKHYQQRCLAYYGKNDLDKFYVEQKEQVEKMNEDHARLMLEVLRKFISQ